MKKIISFFSQLVSLSEFMGKIPKKKDSVPVAPVEPPPVFGPDRGPEPCDRFRERVSPGFFGPFVFAVDDLDWENRDSWILENEFEESILAKIFDPDWSRGCRFFDTEAMEIVALSRYHHCAQVFFKFLFMKFYFVNHHDFLFKCLDSNA